MKKGLSNYLGRRCNSGHLHIKNHHLIKNMTQGPVQIVLLLGTYLLINTVTYCHTSSAVSGALPLAPDVDILSQIPGVQERRKQAISTIDKMAKSGVTTTKPKEIQFRFNSFILASGPYLYTLPFVSVVSQSISRSFAFFTENTIVGLRERTLSLNIGFFIQEKIGVSFYGLLETYTKYSDKSFDTSLSCGIANIYGINRLMVLLGLASKFLTVGFQISIGLIQRSAKYSTQDKEGDISFVDEFAGFWRDRFQLTREESIVASSKITLRDGRFLEDNLLVISYSLCITI